MTRYERACQEYERFRADHDRLEAEIQRRWNEFAEYFHQLTAEEQVALCRHYKLAITLKAASFRDVTTPSDEPSPPDASP